MGASSSVRLFSSTAAEEDFFATEVSSFESMGIQSPILLERLQKAGLEKPTQVQASSFSALREGTKGVTIGAETGSGKTLSYLLPLLDDILQQKQKIANGEEAALQYDYARALILVPNKELVQQVVRMAVPLCGDSESDVLINSSVSSSSSSSSSIADPATTVRIAIMPGGLAEPLDFRPFRETKALGGTEPPIDLIISTPAAVGPLGPSPKHIEMFADIQTLIIDEADMLLDGGYIRQLENVLLGFKRADRLDPAYGAAKTQHVFCAATLPDMGLRSVDAYLQKKFPYSEQIQMEGMHNAKHYGLAQSTVWKEIETKKERMELLQEMLQITPEEGGLKGEKLMLFVNSVDDVEGAHGALERAGVSSVPFHAKIKLGERSTNLDRFRRYNKDEPDAEDTVPVLVCTDLASRGLDVPGVNVVVQLQFAGNVVSHLHRMGRCGRAGQRTGRGIVFYNSVEAELVEVLIQAEEQQERMVLEGDVMDTPDDEEDEEGEGKTRGKVKKAFSRKRGFTKKKKKERREARSEHEA
ncbi:unnamed protein product [Cylindrotheca closterium]|uniref:RNA helicase n=1 Tax=Cylindrotheca closterium TaxID=2856 RepID=A0AAD2FN06_9STRA|nr:unnamed protein product [Cylindrotheca closterium]